jgi:hypothetical protein
MSLGDKGQSAAFGFGELGQRIGQIRAVLDGSEVAARARAEPVPELVDRPQVDARGVEREAVAVVNAGVFAEPVQEDHRRARLGGGPMPVVRVASLVLDEGHGHKCARFRQSANRFLPTELLA